MTYKIIPLTKGFVTIVDEADYDWLNQWKWHYSKGRAHRTERIGLRKYNRKIHFLMHRVIKNAPKNMVVDHKDGDALNNCRSNLRICTQCQNTKNQTPRKNTTSKYKGVSWSEERQKWVVFISHDKHHIPLGRYIDEIKAAIVYNEAALKLHGEYAKLNIIEKLGDN